MKKLKGPELKMPELKAPTFLADLYYDLRDRRLLPLVALVVVAIAAVPFLLGGDVEQPPLPVAGAETAALEASVGKTSKLTVVEATPGLRDYRKRLRGRAATDPFKQRFTEPAGGSASRSSGGDAVSSSSSSSSEAFTEEAVTTESSTTTAEVESGGSPHGGGSSNGSGGASHDGGPGQGTQLIEFVFDVQISHLEETAGSGQEMSEPEVRRGVKTLTQLPSKKVPVVTVAGVNLHNGNVWFLVSDEATSLDGDFNCVTRPPAGLCELLEIKPGFPLELVYGPDRILYRLKVTKIDTISAGSVGDGSRSSRAAFGVPGALRLPAP